MSIDTETDLRSTLEGLSTLYRGLEALRIEFGSQPGHLRLMAEGPLDEIKRLEAELQAYSALFHAPPPVGLWFTLIGGLARWAETPTRVLSGSLDALRRSVQSIASYDLFGRSDIRPTRTLLEASDPELVLLGSGSLRIGLRWRHWGQTSLLPTEEGAVATALESAIRAVRELETDGVNALAEESPTRRRVIFRAIAQLSPTARGDVEAIALSGPQVGKRAALVLSPRINELARAAIREVTSSTESSYDGEIRELDLDKRSFRLRGVDIVGEVACQADDQLEFRRIRELLDSRVRVFGARGGGTLRGTFVVTDVEALEEDE